MTQEAIEHPKHYTYHPSGVEAIEICELIGFNCGCAFKYLFRRNSKHEDPTTDLRKALWYVRRELSFMNAGAISVSALLEPLVGDYSGNFFSLCFAEVEEKMLKILEIEDSFVAGAMAHLVRGYELQDEGDLAVAAHYIEREIAKHAR